jgi:hypothetical protein
MQANRPKVGTLTWQHHRTKHPRNCDQCPPRHPAIWNFHLPKVPPMYLCDDHARRLAVIYEIEGPPGVSHHVGS